MPKIFINPGHCVGVEPGACGNGLQEADVALRIAQRVEKYLQAVGYSVKLFHYNGLAEICDDANSWNADLFVSVHCNSFNGRANGTETIYSEGSVDGKKLAGCIQRQIVNKLGIVDRGLKTKIAGGYDAYVTKYTDMPAVLVEIAFIDNADDAKLLKEREDDFARAVACGISDYYASYSANMPDIVDVPTVKVSNSKLSEHFDKSEFACHHCGQCAIIHPRLIELLEKLRENIGGYPLHINSGYRCPVHNANVGGVPNSQHVLGTAADLAVPPQLTFDQFKHYVTNLPFDWVGLYPYSNFIHVDVRNGGIYRHQGDWME